MTLQVVGAGLGRTGTNSLKLALEQLLGAPCYHMLEVLQNPEFTQYWQDAIDGKPVDWDRVMTGYAACVDWPAAAFWRELASANPDAVVLLSTRSSAAAWFKSANDTIFRAMDLMGMPMPVAMITKTFTPDWRDADKAMAAYEAHNAAVRAEVPAARLVEWQPGDGWAPLCTALGVPVPDAEFPHVNTTEDFRAMLDALTPDQP